MSGKLDIFQIGQYGVDLVKSDLHIPDGAWRLAENAEFPNNLGQGGLKKRGGLSPINGIALAGQIKAATNVPFPFPGDSDLLVGLTAAMTPNSWKLSINNGSSFTNILATALMAPTRKDWTSVLDTDFTVSVCPCGIRAATLGRQFLFAGDDYQPDDGVVTDPHTAPPLVVWDGTQEFVAFRMPTNPTSPAGGTPLMLSDLWVDHGILYLSVYDTGGSAPNLKGRVIAVDLEGGNLALVGNRFGNDSGENTKGFPFVLTSYIGRLWAGTFGISGNNQGAVYSILPGIEDSWTLDLTATLHNGYVVGLAAYNGKLYAAMNADSSGTPIIQQRTSTGTWTTSFTSPTAGIGYCGPLIVFDGNLYAFVVNSSASTALIKKYDGTSWTTDRDVNANEGAFFPGQPFVDTHENALYWPLMHSGESNTAQVLLKRTTGGVYSHALSNVGLRGCVGRFNPSSD